MQQKREPAQSALTTMIENPQMDGFHSTIKMQQLFISAPSAPPP
jgi:hypothetical protein